MLRLTLMMCVSMVGLTGCAIAGGDRYIATANEDLLVVVAEVVDGPLAGGKSATAYYILACPQAVDAAEAYGRRVTRMTYRPRFDCRAGAWAAINRRYEFEDGSALDASEPEAGFEGAVSGSVAGRIIATVCDPKTARDARTGRSLDALERRYRGAR